MLEKTLVLIKPDGVQRGLIGKIISRFEDAGLKVIAMKMSWVDKKFAEDHYYDVEERHGKEVLMSLVGYLSAGPVIAIVLEGVESIANIRKITGSTYPNESLPGTIRGDFSHISKKHANKHGKAISNLIHASANEDDAKKEIALWFNDKEMHTYKISHEEHVL